MLKLINIKVENGIATMLVLIEGKEHVQFKLTLDFTSETYKVIESEIPKEFALYERQARIALLGYKNKPIPSELTSAWC